MADTGAFLRVATFNVSMEGGNYVQPGVAPSGRELPAALGNGEHPQIRNIAEIIQRVRPDIVLLNEFDYHPEPWRAVRPFVDRYLKRRQSGREPIDFPHVYQAPVNTGVDSGVDLDRDGEASGRGQDALPPLVVSSTTLIDTIVLYFHSQILLKSLC